MSDQHPDRDPGQGWEPDGGFDDEPQPWVAGVEPDDDGDVDADPGTGAAAEPPAPPDAHEPVEATDSEEGQDTPSWQVTHDSSPEDPAPWASSAGPSEPGADAGGAFEHVAADAEAWDLDGDEAEADAADTADDDGGRIELTDLDDDFDLSALEAAVVEMGFDEGDVEDLLADDDGGGADERTPRTAIGDQLGGGEPSSASGAPPSDEPLWDDRDPAEPADDAPEAVPSAPTGKDQDEPGDGGSDRALDLRNFTAKGGSGSAGGRGKGRRRLFGR